MERTKKTLSIGAISWVFCFLYFTSYMTRIHFAAIIQEVVTDTGYAKSELSIILVCLSVAYGTGQIISGFLGDRIRPGNLILCGLMTSTTVNILFPFCSGSVPLMAVMWTINGFAQAMLWPPMVKILVANSDELSYSRAVVRVSWGSSFGTIVVYLIAPLIISLVGWRGVFAVSASVGLLGTLIWATLRRRVSDAPLAVPVASATKAAKSKNFSLPQGVMLPLILICLGIMLQGMLRDGVQSWMPTYLSEVFAFDNAVSIFCTVALALFSIVCFSLFDGIYRKWFRNEVACAGVIFLGATAAALVMFIFFDAVAVVAILMMTLITGAMHGINLMLISHVPKRFKRYGNISTISGVVNACTYVGSAVATYGIAKLSEVIGWQYTVGLWAVITLLGALCCFVAMKKWKKFIV